MKTFVLSVLVATLIASTSPDARARSSFPMLNVPARSQLIGLDETLDPTNEIEDPSLIARRLWALQFDRFIQMQRDWLNYVGGSHSKEYLSADRHKAGALCLDKLEASSGLTFMHEQVLTHASAWGTGSGSDSQADANFLAMASCEDAKKKYGHKGCECRLVADDEGAIPGPPADWVAAIPPIQREIQVHRGMRLNQSKITVTLSTTLDAFSSENRILDNDAMQFLGNFRFRLPLPLVVGYPDQLRDYASACHERYSYAVFQVDSARAQTIMKEFSHIELGKPFGCYAITVNTQDNPMIPQPGQPTAKT